jgi:hypothetical protein
MLNLSCSSLLLPFFPTDVWSGVSGARLRFGELSGLNIFMKPFTFSFTLLLRLFSPEGGRELLALGLADEASFFV